jgi:anti-sigma B factor antagonist
MRINERRFGDAAILDLHGPMVGWEASGMLEAAVGRHAAEGRSVLVANLSGVNAVDSRGLGALVAAHSTIERAGGTFRLAAVNKRIQDMVVLSRLLTFFDTFDTVEDAVGDVRAALSAPARPAASESHGFWLWPGMHRLLRRA